MDVATYLIDWIGLRIDFKMKKSMLIRDSDTLTSVSSSSYRKRITGKGTSERNKGNMRVACTYCGKELQRTYISRFLQAATCRSTLTKPTRPLTQGEGGKYEGL